MTDPADPLYGDALARVHDEGFGDPARRAADALLEALGGGVAGARILDLGCGSGIASERLALAGADVIGIDPSAAMLELARGRAPGARFVVGSVHDPDPLPACDAVLAVGEVVNYVGAGRPDGDALTPVLRRIADALVPGGLLLLDAAGPGRAGAGGVRATTVGDRVVESAAREDGGLLVRDILVRDADGVATAREEHRLALVPPSEVEASLRRAGFAARRLPADEAWTGAVHGWHAWRAVRDPALTPFLGGG